MKNNYQKEISKYKLSNNTKEKLFNKINKLNTKGYKLSYSIIIILFTCIISIGVVYAKDIKNFIESWGKTKISFYNKKDQKEEIELDSIKTIKTNLDDYIFDEKIYKDLVLNSKDNSIAVEGITYFKDKNIDEIRKEIGVNILGIEKLKYEYQYDEITKERKIGSIFIKSNEYIEKCGIKDGKESCNPLASGYKGFSILAHIKTINTNVSSDNEWSYDTSHHPEDLQIKNFNKIGSFDVKGFSFTLPIIVASNGTTDGFVTEMHFNYENVRYTINATNLTHQEITNILEPTLR